MNQFLLRLRILNTILENKISVLNQILNITENQQTVLSAGSSDEMIMDLYSGMVDEKQKLIDTINESDKVFEKTFKEISPDFETEAPKHAGLVARMQDGIKRATALDVRIRVQESRNNAARRTIVKVKDNKSTRKHVTRIYEKNKYLLAKQPPG